MSGHSKWSTIKHKKGAADAKRGVLFTKLANMIIVAARQGGGDPEMNFSLRMAIDKARAANVPKENIERAIKRGTGEIGGESLEEMAYEGFGPGKVSMVVEVLTDNKNRTVNEVKNIFSKHGGTLGVPGSVRWQFEKMGVFFMEETPNIEELELRLIDFGALDVQNEGGKLTAYFKPEEFESKKKKFEEEGIKFESAEMELVAKDKIKITGEEEEKMQKLIEELEEDQDVVNYFTNLKYE